MCAASHLPELEEQMCWLGCHLASLLRRSVVSSPNATGFSGWEVGWREVDYAVKSNLDWVKTHAAIDVETLIVLRYGFSPANVHDF